MCKGTTRVDAHHAPFFLFSFFLARLGISSIVFGLVSHDTMQVPHFHRAYTKKARGASSVEKSHIFLGRETDRFASHAEAR